MPYLQRKFSKLLYISLLSIATIFSSKSYAHTPTQDISMWPKAEDGYQRIIINLPQINDEDSHKIELIPQKTMSVDCNHTFINGEIEKKPLQGWGYDYYVLSKVFAPASTRMACLNNKTTQQDITITTQLPFIRYNSKLPVVVYIPKDVQLSYRVWSAGPLIKTIHTHNQ